MSQAGVRTQEHRQGAQALRQETRTRSASGHGLGAAYVSAQAEKGRRLTSAGGGGERERRLFSTQATTTLAPLRIDPPSSSVHRLQFLLSLATDDCDGVDSGEGVLVPASDTLKVGIPGSNGRRLSQISPSSVEHPKRHAFAVRLPLRPHPALSSLSVPPFSASFTTYFTTGHKPIQSTPQPPAPTS